MIKIPLLKWAATPRQLYIGLLGRVPARGEAIQMVLGQMLWQRKSLGEAIRVILESEEFALMTLPHLTARALKNFGPDSKKLFFVHVPKASGTSLRLTIANLMGVPPLDYYARTSSSPAALLDPQPFQEFWPFVCGHLNLHQGPYRTHTVLTTVREPRSRYLSLFRQQTRLPYGTNPHLVAQLSALELRKKTIRARRLEKNFSSWLAQIPPSHLAQFADPLSPVFDFSEEAFSEIGNQAKQRKALARQIHSLSSADLSKVVRDASRKIDLVSWSDGESMAQLLSSALGEKVSASDLPRDNDGTNYARPVDIQLSTRDLERLSELSAPDMIFFSHLVEAGKLVPMSEGEANREFENTARRLGFILPN